MIDFSYLNRRKPGRRKVTQRLHRRTGN